MGEEPVRVAEIGTAGGMPIYIEVSPADVEVETIAASQAAFTGTGASGGDRAVDKLSELGESFVDVCRRLATSAEEGLKKQRPAEVTVEFGLTLAGEGGVPMVTKASGEASIKVTATWRYEQDAGDAAST